MTNILTAKEIKVQIALGLDLFIPLNEELNEDKMNYLLEKNIHFAIYDYESEPYEGSGNMVYISNDRWDLHSMRHCSCYGPTEEIKELQPSEGYDTLSELIEACSDEVKKNIKKMTKILIEKDE